MPSVPAAKPSDTVPAGDNEYIILDLYTHTARWPHSLVEHAGQRLVHIKLVYISTQTKSSSSSDPGYLFKSLFWRLKDLIVYLTGNQCLICSPNPFKVQISCFRFYHVAVVELNRQGLHLNMFVCFMVLFGVLSHYG